MDGFLVKGKPFFPIGAQAHNSSSYSKKELGNAVRAALLAGCNTLEAPVYWNIVEPQEGVFDFSMAKDMIDLCRHNGLKLIVLWFASWKNGEMHYCPDYIKKDTERFKRVLSAESVPVWDLSLFCEDNRDADARAFAGLMAFLRKYDEQEQTVIAVQVQNEPGTLRTDKDYSPAARKAHLEDVPGELISFLRKEPPCEARSIWEKNGTLEEGSWGECFGLRGPELCEAMAMAKYIDHVAAAGKAEYDLPMLVNVWVAEHPWRVPGINYPSGGAIPLTLPVWKWAAKSIDIIAPDIYTQNYEHYKKLCDIYDRPDNPLMVPESSSSAKNARYLFYAVGNKNCVGYSIFGAESMLNDDGGLLERCRPLADSFHSLRAALPLLYRYRGTGRIHSVVQDYDIPSDFYEFERYIGCVPYIASGPRDLRRDYRNPTPEIGEPWQRGLIFEAAPDLLYLAGNFNLRLSPKSSPAWNLVDRDMQACEFLSVEEGHFDESGEFVCDRRRNGDEVVFGGFWVTTACKVVRVKLL
ncbi:MAG: DUF5597 domain-containing protein [Christensenellales bacterium]|jgi:hypothetical protein